MPPLFAPTARWIAGAAGSSFSPFTATPPAAPYLRTVFTCRQPSKTAVARVAVAGWHELYINGQKADDRVLSPVVTQFTQRVSAIDYDIARLLRPGKNAVAAVLGTGWYDCHTEEVWQFRNAGWRDAPKMICGITVDGETVAVSGRHWKTRTGPTIFDGLRNGDFYDARLEIPGFADPDLDDAAWDAVAAIAPPPGVVEPERLEPCKVMRRYRPVAKYRLAAEVVTYDFGVNLTGWCELTVTGPAGAEVKLVYGELVRDNHELEREDIRRFVKSGQFQEDHYILKGGGQAETWAPRFTYHGFRYVQVMCWNPEVKVERLEAHFVHNAFASAGTVSSSDATLDRLQEITRQAYLGNFTGIPTDCPHREKNGWTGDAQLALETGLWNFDAGAAYRHFLRVFADGQRPSGQFSGIAPTGGWGYNWGSGPAWDSLIFEGPYQLLLFYGDDAAAREHYDAMKRYLDYCQLREEDGLLDFGLGDWCHFDNTRIAPVQVTSTGYYHGDTERMAFFARHFGRDSDADHYTRMARRIRERFLAKFGREDGSYADDSWTALATALYFHLASDPAKTAARLVEKVRANGHRVDFGILGAKFTPRVLADHGYAADAYRLLTQPDFPGWGFWVKSGATTLWEHWNGRASRNHIMFGDVSAWMYQYLGGLCPDRGHPGFKRFTLKPRFVPQLDHFTAEYHSVAGPIRSAWRREGGRIHYEASIPSGATATLVLPGLGARDVRGRVQQVVDAHSGNADTFRSDSNRRP